jgi:palmitoyltransferase ZDHHC13/17
MCNIRLNFISSFRYRHFIARGGKSPFDQGFCQNFADFFGCKVLGLVKPQSKDWLRFYWHEFEFGEKLEAEPLLNASDNYQYV